MTLTPTPADEVALPEPVDCADGPCHFYTSDQMRAYARAAIAADRAKRAGWLPIEQAQEGVFYVVGWKDADDTETPDRHDFDWLEDGVWQQHHDNREHFEMVAPPGSVGPSRAAPYTHCMPIGDLPPAPTPPQPAQTQEPAA